MAIEFLKVLERRDPVDVREIWEVFDRDDYLAMMLIDQIWLDEARAVSSDWPTCIQSLEYAAQLALKRKAKALAVAAYRAKAIVEEEYVNDSSRAMLTLSEGAEVIGADSVLFLEDYRARTYFFKKQYEKALDIWRRILPIMEREQNLGRTFSYREAEICAARLNNWREAAEFAQKGEEAARQPWLKTPAEQLAQAGGEVVAWGFRADYGFALWKLNERPSAVTLFAKVLDAFSWLPALQNDARAEMFYRRVGYAIGWLVTRVDKAMDFEEPPPGFFSNQEIIEEVKNMPLQPQSSLWYLLAKLELGLKVGDEIFRRFEAEIKSAGLSHSKLGYWNLRLRHALAKLDVDELVPDFLSYSADLKIYSKQSAVEDADWSESSELIKLLFAVIIKLCAAGQYCAIPVARWKEDASRFPQLDNAFFGWLEFIQRTLQLNNYELTATLRSEATELEKRAVAAVLLSTQESIDPETRFYANVVLTITDFNKPWQDDTGDTIASIVGDAWKAVVQHQRFALRSPEINSPIIALACSDISYTGIQKAARILLAAKPALDTGIAGVELERLRQRAML